MDYLIYTFGQAQEFKNVLVAISMMFDPDNTQFFVSGSGSGMQAGSAVLLASMIAMVGVMSSYMSQSKSINATGPVIGLIVYGALAVPKVDTTYIQDLYTGETLQVANLPLGIAMLGHAFSNIAKGMMSAYETNATNVGVDTNMTDKNGFLSPLKMMTALRNLSLGHMPEHLKFNLTSYTYFCLNKKIKDYEHNNNVDKFSISKMNNSTDPITYFLSDSINYSVTGTSGQGDSHAYAEKMNPATGAITIDTCDKLRTTLDSDSAEGGIRNHMLSSGEFGELMLSKLLNNNIEVFGDCSATSTCLTTIASIDKTKDVMATILGSQEQANLYLEMSIAQEIANLSNLTGTIDQGGIENIGMTMATLVTQARTTEVIEGETFLRFMMRAMNAMTLLFYAVFPIVLVVAVAKGAQSLTYIGGYIVMGLWVYSWMPVASIINFTTTSSLIQVFEIMNGQFQMSPSTVPAYVQEALDALSVGSNLLAATPVITLAIISGSMFALTSVASSSASPTGGSSQAVAQNVATPGSATLASLQSKYSAASAGANAAGGKHHAMSFLEGYTFNNGKSTSNTSTLASQQVTSAENALSGSITNLLNHAQTVTTGNNSTFQTAFGQARGTAFESILRQALENAGVDTLETGHNKMATAGYALLAGKPPVGVAFHNSESTNNRTIAERSEAFRSEMAKSLASSDVLNITDSTSTGATKSNESSKLFSDVREKAETYNKVTSAAETQSRERKAVETSGNNYTMTGTQIADRLSHQHRGLSFNQFKSLFSNLREQTAGELNMANDGAQFGDQIHQYADKYDYGVSGGDAVAAAIGASMENETRFKQQIAKLEGKGPEQMLSDEDKFHLHNARQGVMMETEFRENLSQMAMGGASPVPSRYRDIVTQTDAVEGNVKGFIAATEGKIGKIEQDVGEGKQSIMSPDRFDPNNLRNARLNMDKFSNAFNQLTSSSAPGFLNDYANKFLSKPALDTAAALEYEGKTFDQLADNQKRQVVSQQQGAAIAAFTENARSFIHGQTGLTREQKSEFNSALNALSSMYGSVEKGALTNQSEGHKEGIIAQGEMRGLNMAAASLGDHATSISNMFNGVRSQSTQMHQDGLLTEPDSRFSTWLTNVTDATSGYDKGIDREAANRVSEAIDTNQQRFANGEITSSQRSNLIDNAIQTEINGGHVGEEFERAYRQNIALGHSPSSAYAMALEDRGINNNGVAERVVDDYVDTAAAVASVFTGASLGKNLANNISEVSKFDKTGGSMEFTDAEGKIDKNAEDSFDSKMKKFNKFMKLGGAVIGAAVTAGYHTSEHIEAKEQNKKDSLSNAISIAGSNVNNTINGLAVEDNERTMIRNQVAQSLFDATFNQATGYTPEMINEVRSTLVDGQGNFSEDSITRITNSAADNVFTQDEFKGPSAKTIVNSYNANNTRHNDI